MSASFRVNGDYGKFTQGTLYSIYQLKAVAVTVKDAGGNPVSLSNEDTDGAGEIDQAVALIVRECQPLMYEFASGGGNNVIHMIVDGHAIDADTLQIRIRNLGTAVGAGPVDVSGTTVAIGTHIAVS